MENRALSDLVMPVECVYVNPRSILPASKTPEAKKSMYTLPREMGNFSWRFLGNSKNRLFNHKVPLHLRGCLKAQFYLEVITPGAKCVFERVAAKEKAIVVKLNSCEGYSFSLCPSVSV